MRTYVAHMLEHVASLQIHLVLPMLFHLKWLTKGTTQTYRKMWIIKKNITRKTRRQLFFHLAYCWIKHFWAAKRSCIWVDWLRMAHWFPLFHLILSLVVVLDISSLLPRYRHSWWPFPMEIIVFELKMDRRGYDIQDGCEGPSQNAIADAPARDHKELQTNGQGTFPYSYWYHHLDVSLQIGCRVVEMHFLK